MSNIRSNGTIAHGGLFVAFLLANISLNHRAFEVGLIADDFYLSARTITDSLFSFGGIYRPLGMMTFVMSSSLAHSWTPMVLHTWGLILHSLNIYLLFRLARDMNINRLIAITATLIALTSPAAIQPVFWLSATVFYLPMVALSLLSLRLAYGSFRVWDQGVIPRTRQLAILSMSLALSSGLALLFHEIAIVLPFILALTIHSKLLLPRITLTPKQIAILWAPTATLMGIYVALRYAQNTPSSLVSQTPSERAANLLYMLWRSVLPPESPIAGWANVLRQEQGPVAWLIVLMVLGIVLVACVAAKPLRSTGWGILCTAVACLPPALFAIAGGRYLYLPSIFGALSVGLMFNAVVGAIRRQAFYQPTLLICFALGQVLVVSNFIRSIVEAEWWVQRSAQVRTLEYQVASLVGTAVNGNPPKSRASEILALDLPRLSLNDRGILTTLNGQFSDSEFSVKTANLDGRDETLPTVGRDALTELVKSQIVLLYCPRDQSLILLSPSHLSCGQAVPDLSPD